jgi:hypothetical protein
MPFWRKRAEPLHERLAREGGLTFPRGPADEVRPPWDQPAVHGVARPRRWDAVASAEAERLHGDEVHFVALPDGTLIVEEDVPDGALAPLADAVEAMVDPPYRAEGVRRDGNVWAVGARRIQVAEVEDEIPGDEVEMAVQGEERTVLVDGEQSGGYFPGLETLAEGFDAFVIRAERLDGSLWEVKVAPL